MPDPTLGTLMPTDQAKVLAKAAEKLGVPPGPTPRECHMRSLSACQNEPYCSEAGECVLFLAIGARRVPVPPTFPSDDERRLMRVAYAICDADGRGKCDCHTDGVFTGGCCNDIRAMARAAIAAMEVK